MAESSSAPSGINGANEQEAPVHLMPVEPLPENEEIEADYDSTYGGSYGDSETTSVNSAAYRGNIENGRRYQTLREGKYWGPSDEKQFAAMEAAHLVMLIMDSQMKNTLFQSPIPETAQNIIDLGTGEAAWAIDVADRHPAATVRGIDLYPPPAALVPPNCILEVDDITEDWTWNTKFDLIHMRQMYGALTYQAWTDLYKRAYDNLAPGGWIEQVEYDCAVQSDDGSLPAGSLLASWGPMFEEACERFGRPLDIYRTMKSNIESAGFVNVHEKVYKIPCGSWPKHPVYKDAGRCNLLQVKNGLEGWVMFLLTKFGAPTPWSEPEVQVYLAKVRNELDQNWHIYNCARRVWAQKPYNTKKEVEPQHEVEDIAPLEVVVKAKVENAEKIKG